MNRPARNFPNHNTGGIASVCSDCTAYPMQGKPGISLGWKGSRKHTGDADEEVVVGYLLGSWLK